jgi:hypothetical protein
MVAFTPGIWLLAQVHYGHNDNLLFRHRDPVDNSKLKPMKPVPTVDIVERLPGVGMFKNVIDAASKFIDQLSAQANAQTLVVIKSLFEIGLGFFKDGRGHGCPLRESRAMTSSTGFAFITPASKPASRRRTSASKAVSIAAQSWASMLTKSSAANASRSLAPSLSAADLIWSRVSVIIFIIACTKMTATEFLQAE